MGRLGMRSMQARTTLACLLFPSGIDPLYLHA